MTIDDYLKQRRRWETVIAASVLLISFAANTAVVTMELSRGSTAFDPWLPLLLEGSSHFAMAIVLPLIFWFDARFPIRVTSWRRSVPAHLLFSVVASFIHVVIMYGLRVFIVNQLTPESPYHWENWWREFAYEYLKDFRTYLLILAMLYLYRFIVARLQGEAGFVDDRSEPGFDGQRDERFLIKKLGREFLVRLNDVDWIEASGNYVNLHVKGRAYPLRETMARISERLSVHGFQRVHRSAIVNLERIRELAAFDSGDGNVILSDDIAVPVSRRYRKELRLRLNSSIQTD